ncbi:hypothetical protein I317_07700 [Kwoniella heveanensis CBS 569]|nr:hypothetical protein I317_07700 [Kwoniella heveanensis CBS 569]
MSVETKFFEGTPEELAASPNPNIRIVSPFQSQSSLSLSTSTSSTSTNNGPARARSSTIASSSATSILGEVSLKRQEEFERYFGEQLRALAPDQVPPDYLTVLETQSADLQAKVLLHGRLYLTPYHLCFRSNILGYKTEYIHPLDKLISVQKGTTAKWIQNAIYVCVDDDALEDKQLGYGSMKDRDSMYTSVVECWKVVAPERYKAYAEKPEVALDPSDVDDGETGSDTSQEASVATSTTGGGETVQVKQTKCTEEGHLKELALDVTFPIALDQVFNLIYHNREFITEFYEVDQELTDVSISDWTEYAGKQQRTLNSVMHMNNPIGPKKTDSVGTETVVVSDPETSYEIESQTQTPDVPSGKSFSVHTRTCLTHAERHGRPATRMYCTTQCDWSASSWLKGTITPAVIKGQKEYHQKLAKKVRDWIKARPEEFGTKEEHLPSEGELEKVTAEEAPKDTTTHIQGTVGTAVVTKHTPWFDHAMEIPQNPVMVIVTGLCVTLLIINLYLLLNRSSGGTSGHTLVDKEVALLKELPALARLEALEARWEALAGHFQLREGV